MILDLARFIDSERPVWDEFETMLARFELAGIDSVGFTHRQRTAKENDAVAHVMENLQAADEWIRFNAEAQCRLSASSIGANIYRVIDPDAPQPHPPITKPAFEVHFVVSQQRPSAPLSLRRIVHHVE